MEEGQYCNLPPLSALMALQLSWRSAVADRLRASSETRRLQALPTPEVCAGIASVPDSHGQRDVLLATCILTFWVLEGSSRLAGPSLGEVYTLSSLVSDLFPSVLRT